MNPCTTWMASLVLVAPLVAQAQFTELAGRHFPDDGTFSEGLALGDINGDGHVDAVSLVRTRPQTSPTHGVWIYANDGTGIFRRVAQLARRGKPVLADVDADGDLDLLIGTSVLLLNDGKGNFGTTSLTLPTTAADNPVFGDVDGDGDLDLVLDAPGTSTQSALLWLNDGKGNFTDASSRMPASGRVDTHDIALVDVDGDKDLDVVLANTPYLITMFTSAPGPTRLFLNDGKGTFTDATSNNLPYDPKDTTLGVLARDFDLDGDVDLILANHQAQNRFYVNNGKGVFTDVTSARLPSTSGLMLALDADSNGRVDLVGQEGGALTLYINKAVSFQKAAANTMPVNLSFVGLGDSGDVDRDGDADLVLLGSGQHRLLLNDGRGQFVDATDRGVWRPRRPTVLGDVDQDGDLDLVFGSDLSSGDSSALLYLNDGDGNFVPVASGGIPQDPHQLQDPMFLVDMDGDSDLDLFCLATISKPTYSRFPKLYLNDGKGNFTDVTANQIPAQAVLNRGEGGSLAVGDVDGDGDVDFVLGVYQKPDRLFLNDGKGTFSQVTGRLPSGNDPTGPVVLADVDGDKDLDLILGQLNWLGKSPTRLYVNDGKGKFTDVSAAQMPAGDNLTNDLALADADGDGDPDLFIGNLGSSSYNQQRNRLYLNDGRGRFTDATAGRLPDVISNSFSLRLGDVDLDGDVDVFLAEYLRGGRLYLNDGRGAFKDAGSRLARDLLGEHYQLADVDGDGDLDLMVDGRLLTNLHVQCHAPLLARPGKPYALDIYSRPGYAPAGQVAIPLASWFRTTIPVPPVGVLRVSPVGLMVLPAVGIVQSSGTGTLSFAMPNNPALVGNTVFVQALVAPTANTASWRLTNVVGSTFWR